MLFLLVVATASVVFAADEKIKADVKEEPKPAESAPLLNDHYPPADGLELMHLREQRLNAEHLRQISGQESYNDLRARTQQIHDLPGPVVLRTPHPLPHQGHPDIEAQNRIIADVFSPDYSQPTWVLDYRYLKTGGRDYTRGPGGQILILPRGVRSNEKKEFPDYDTYIEHLRLSRLSERQKHKQGFGDGYEHGHSHAPTYSQGHGQTLWHKYG